MLIFCLINWLNKSLFYMSYFFIYNRLINRLSYCFNYSSCFWLNHCLFNILNFCCHYWFYYCLSNYSVFCSFTRNNNSLCTVLYFSCRLRNILSFNNKLLSCFRSMNRNYFFFIKDFSIYSWYIFFYYFYLSLSCFLMLRNYLSSLLYFFYYLRNIMTFNF